MHLAAKNHIQDGPVYRTQYLSRILSLSKIVASIRLLTAHDKDSVTYIGSMSDQESGPVIQRLDLSSKKKGKYRSKRSKTPTHGWSWADEALAPDTEQPSIGQSAEVIVAAEEPSLGNGIGATSLPEVSEAVEPAYLQDTLEGELPRTLKSSINGLSISGTAPIDNASVSSSGVLEYLNPRQG